MLIIICFLFDSGQIKRMSANNESDNDTNGTEKIHCQNMGTNIQDMSLILAELIKTIKSKPLSEEGDMSLLLAELIKTIEKKPPSEEEGTPKCFVQLQLYNLKHMMERLIL